VEALAEDITKSIRALNSVESHNPRCALIASAMNKFRALARHLEAELEPSRQ